MTQIESARAPDEREANATSSAATVGWLDVLLVAARYRKVLLVVPIAAAIIAAVVSLVLPPTYTATTRLLPPQQSDSAAMLLGQLGGFAAVAGDALGKGPGDLYVAMLRSDTVADRLIDQFKLKDLYDLEEQWKAREKLAKASNLREDKDGILVIEASAPSAQLAADLANAYVAELQRLTNTLAVTDAAKRRLFFEQQLARARDVLSDSEAKLRASMEAGGILSVDAQGRAALETAAALRAQITAKELEISAMNIFATAANPDMARAQQQLASMRRELSRIESGLDAAPSADGARGGRGLDNLRLLRTVKYNEAIAELLTKQYELSRIEEAKEAPTIQVLDPAQPPERRSAPKRALITIAAFAGALFLTAVTVFTLHALRCDLASEDQQRKLQRLRESWRGPQVDVPR